MKYYILNNDRSLFIGNSCRYKVVKWLKKKYESPIDAEGMLTPKTSVETQTDLSNSRPIASQKDLSSIASQMDLSSSRSIACQTNPFSSRSIASQTVLLTSRSASTQTALLTSQSASTQTALLTSQSATQTALLTSQSASTQTALFTSRSASSQTFQASSSVSSQTDRSTTRSIGIQINHSTSTNISSLSSSHSSAHSSHLSNSLSASDLYMLKFNTPEQSSISTLSQTFSTYCKKSLQLDVPVDFLAYAGTAIARLKESGRANVVYNLVKGIGKDRQDSSDARFPVSRMPMGLIEYATNFYVAENINQVSVTSHILLYMHAA